MIFSIFSTKLSARSNELYAKSLGEKIFKFLDVAQSKRLIWLMIWLNPLCAYFRSSWLFILNSKQYFSYLNVKLIILYISNRCGCDRSKHRIHCVFLIPVIKVNIMLFTKLNTQLSHVDLFYCVWYDIC